MTERLYYNDSALLQFDARIVGKGEENGRFYTELDRSAFYPTSGGQPSDTGELAGVAINEVLEADGEAVRHYSSQPVGEVGQAVTGRVDQDRRQANCRKHTAQHILSHVFVRLFDGVTVSVHLGEEYAAIELDQPAVTEAQMLAVEDLANEIVLANEPVQVAFAQGKELEAIPLRKPPKRTGRIRIISIGDFEYSACGGTHCRSTAEVGIIKIIATEQLRQHALVKFLVGTQALSDYRQRLEVTASLTRNLTCGISELGGNIEKLVADNKDLKRQLNLARKQLLPIQAATLAENVIHCGDKQVVMGEVDDLDGKQMPVLAAEVAAIINGLAVLFSGERLFLATTVECDLHAGKLAKQIGVEGELKGGGNDRLAQLGGVMKDKREQVRSSIERIIADG